jgi:hypothetical protein
MGKQSAAVLTGEETNAWWLAYKSSRSPELAENLLGTKKTGLSSAVVGSSKIHMVVLVRVYGEAA